jgi:uncharacterized RDD family membrane protein YckC
MPCKNHPFVEDRLTRCSRCAEAFCPDCIVEIGGLPYCLSCKTESMRDLRSGVPLGELDLASVGHRFGALVIDFLITTLPIMVVAFLVLIPFGLIEAEEQVIPTSLAIVTNLLVALGGVAIKILYEGLMLASGGQTVGKKAMKVKVVTAEGGEITTGQAWGRAASRQILGVVPCLNLVNYLVAFGQEHTTIHDMMAKTRVVNWE